MPTDPEPSAADRTPPAKMRIEWQGGVRATNQQLQKKFKHALDFGVAGTGSKADLAIFEAALQQHVSSGDVLHIDGSYRGQAAILHVDARTGLTVITDRSGNFISGWRLAAQQVECALTNGKLGGG